MAQQSPLTRWAGQSVLKHVRFQLTLDDPKLPKDQWVTLRGDRAQLEALREVVSDYVQNFLERSQSLLNVPETPSSGEAIAVFPSTAAWETTALVATANRNGLALKPRGLLAHELLLGTLAPPETNGMVHLSTLQLFDLANALDEYATDGVALPTLSRSRWALPTTLNWGQMAAAGLIVIGLSASVAKLVDNSMKSGSPATSQGASSSDQQIATQLPPSTADNSAPSIASDQKLPPPPPIGSTVPASPGLPTFPLTSPTTSAANPKLPAGTMTINPAPTTRAQTKAGGNQVAMLPGTVFPGAAGAARSQPLPPMPKPLAMKREFANAPPPQAGAATRSAAGDRLSQTETGTAFDTIPQVAEARQYFQRRWSPPQGITQTLEYTLLVGANGSIQRAIPLGQASGDYIDRTGMPLVGEPFVSAISGGRNAKIRLVLSPDGAVKTFLEGFY